MSQTEWIILGISGVSCSGKSTLAQQLHALVASALVQQDTYFLPDNHHRHTKCEQLTQHHNDYDILSALDMKRMIQDITHVINGASELQQSCAEHKYKMADKKKLLIIEGFTILNYAPILDLCTLAYYMDVPYEECRRRRESRVYDPPDVDGYFDIYVWPRHLTHIEQVRQHDTKVDILDGRTPTMQTINIMIEALQAHGLVQC